MNMASYTSKSASAVPLALCRSALLLVVAIAAISNADHAENGLKVEKLYVPEVCDIRSKKGDQLTMHYTGTLLAGSKFDSRSVTFAANERVVAWTIGGQRMCEVEYNSARSRDLSVTRMSEETDL